MNRQRIWMVAGLAAVGAILIGDHALAANSLGIGGSEQAIRPTGFFAPILFWIKNEQASFYELMRGQLLALRTDDSRVAVLAGLSFAYGIFHAAGPGHGKAVISSYMIANELAARRGIALAFASSFAQAVSAIVVVAALALLLRGAGLRQQNVTTWLEISSYGAVTLLGAWLLWTKIFRRGHDHGHEHEHVHGHDEHAHDHDSEHGHSHAPDPAMLTGTLGLRQAWSAILAVGLRPCSGALIVLTFAFLNGLYFAGVISVFAMAVGTGVTVAALAALAVWAKNIAVRVGGAADRAAFVHRAAEIIGAAMVLLLGATLLAASLA